MDGSSRRPDPPALLTPLRQQPARFVSLAIRVKGDPLAFAPALAEHVREVDADTPTYWVRSYDQVMRQATFDQRLLAQMFAAFGIVALILAGAGVYGVIAFNVTQRTREIGVRRALGASSRNVFSQILGRSGWLVGGGLAIGLGLGLALRACSMRPCTAFPVWVRRPLICSARARRSLCF